MGNAVQIQKNVFSEYCWEDVTKNFRGNIANQVLSGLSESKFEG
jgi:hypothetical protein